MALAIQVFTKKDESVLRVERKVGARFLERSSTGKEVELGKIDP